MENFRLRVFRAVAEEMSFRKAAEVLHLYREVHLIEELSEQLAALLDLAAVSQSALAQAQRLIHATQGSILVMDKVKGLLSSAASFGIFDGDFSGGTHPLGLVPCLWLLCWSAGWRRL